MHPRVEYVRWEHDEEDPAVRAMYKCPVSGDWRWQTYHLTDLIVMQSTGLKDKNGKEIFEGDMVKSQWQHDGMTNYDYELVGEIRWNSDVLAWSIFHEGESQILDYPMHSFEREELLEDGIEVIGNIYENPDLLPPVSHE